MKPSALITLLIVPLQMFLIAFAIQGMRQEWNVEEGAPIQDEPVHGEAQPPQAAKTSIGAVPAAATTPNNALEPVSW